MESVNLAENTAPVDAAKPDGEASATGEEGSAPSAPKAGTSEDTSSWTEKAQKRYDELTRKAYEAQAERDRERYQRESLQAQLAELQKAKPEPVAPEAFPTLEQFGYDEGQYQAALAKHFSKLASEQGRTAAQQALESERQRVQQETTAKTWTTKEAEFAKLKPDYLDKVRRDPRDGGPVINKSMADLIMESTVGPEVAYYLAENVDQSALIAQMPPTQQAREIGRIEAKLELAKAPPRPAVSQAPPPPSKVEADDSVTTAKVDSADSDALSDAEWTRRRNLQEKARLRKQRGG